MKHYDQNTIELYVLGSRKIEGFRAELEQHLTECYTCRSVAQELTEFYQAVGNERPLLTTASETRTDSIVLNPEYRPVPRPKSTIPSKTWAVVRAHPISASVAPIFILAIALLLWNTHKPDDSTNPDHILLNESVGGLVVYNKADEILWQIPQTMTRQLVMVEAGRNIRYTRLADVNGDGWNEVVTTLPMPEESGYHPFLRVFDSRKKTILEKQFADRSISYRGKPYDATFEPMYPLLLTQPGKNYKEILVAASNRRSPTFVARMDIQGTILGRMWHYGALGVQYMVDLDDDGNEEMILCGVSDVDEDVTGPGSVILVLDPTKIIGETESTASRGFGHKATDCERYYILLPQSDISAALGSRLHVTALESSKETVLRFSTQGAKEVDAEQFEIIFSKDLRVLEVKTGTWTAQLHAKLKAQGKLSSVFDQKYLEDMKNRVQYWDGQRWVSKHTMVNHAGSSPIK